MSRIRLNCLSITMGAVGLLSVAILAYRAFSALSAGQGVSDIPSTTLAVIAAGCFVLVAIEFLSQLLVAKRKP